MSTTLKTTRSRAIANFLGQLDDDEQRDAVAALDRVWRAAADAADPDAPEPTGDELEQLQADLRSCGLRSSDFKAMVGDIARTRALRQAADVPAAQARGRELDDEARELVAKAAELQREIEQLEARRSELAREATRIRALAKNARQDHDTLAQKLLERGCTLPEIARPLAPVDRRPVARVRALEALWIWRGSYGEFVKPGSVVTMKIAQSDIDHGRVQFLGWLDAPRRMKVEEATA